MRLHVVECPCCGRTAIRLDEEKHWAKNMVNISLARLKELHDVLSEAERVCEICQRTIQNTVTLAAGVTH